MGRRRNPPPRRLLRCPPPPSPMTQHRPPSAFGPFRRLHRRRPRASSLSSATPPVPSTRMRHRSHCHDTANDHHHHSNGVSPAFLVFTPNTMSLSLLLSYSLFSPPCHRSAPRAGGVPRMHHRKGRPQEGGPTEGGPEAGVSVRPGATACLAVARLYHST